MKTITNVNNLTFRNKTNYLHNNSHGVKKNSALEKLHDFQIFKSSRYYAWLIRRCNSNNIT